MSRYPNEESQENEIIQEEAEREEQSQAEYDEAMRDMECYQSQKHLKECSKCRNQYQDELMKCVPEKKDDSSCPLDNYEHPELDQAIGWNQAIETFKENINNLISTNERSKNER